MTHDQNKNIAEAAIVLAEQISKSAFCRKVRNCSVAGPNGLVLNGGYLQRFMFRSEHVFPWGIMLEEHVGNIENSTD